MNAPERKPSGTFTGPLSEAPTGLLVGSAPGERLGGRYTLLGLLGVGGMGSVYRAKDEELDEIVALKVLRQDMVDEPGMLDRFRREVKLARRVTHRNVARVFDIGEHGSDKYLTMEYVEGEALAGILNRQGPMPVSRVVAIATDICAGLAAAHEAGVIHRDLKPDNVLLAKDGRAVITDFGIARAFVAGDVSRTQLGTAVGTPAYMAPEQVQGLADIDARADIYALGCMLYEMLTGERAWRGDSVLTIAAARLIEAPPDPHKKRPDLPSACRAVVLKCMAKDRDERFATAQAVAEELSNLTIPAANKVIAPVGTLVTPAAPTPVAAAPTPTTAATDKTVAVLPFRNAGPADDDYLAEGLTDDLIDTLSMTKGLKVRPRGVVMRFKGVDQDPREIGRELGVCVVVEGSVRRTPAGVRISARVLSVADGFQLWAKRFDRPEKDLLVVNDEVAKAIAEALTVDATAPAREAPTDPIAIDLYLRARAEYRKFFINFAQQAVVLFEQALARAPEDPTILAGYAMARARLVFFNGENAQVAVQVAERALAAAPHLGETHLAMGLSLFQLGDTAGAVRSLRQAFARAPGLADVHMNLGMILSEVGLLDDAQKLLETAHGLDPAAPMVARTLARVVYMRGDWDRAAHLMQEARRIEGETSYVGNMGRLLMWRQDAELIEKLAASHPQPENFFQKIILEALVHRRSPYETPEFQQAFESNTTGGWRRWAFFRQLGAEICSFLGDDARALHLVDGAVEAGLIDLAWIDHCPLVAKFRGHPAYDRARRTVEERARHVIEAYRLPLG